jgi:hypothetical protein
VNLKMFRGEQRVFDQENDITRVETTHVMADGQQYRMFMLDCDDTIDMVVHYPNGEREIVWSLVKDAA